MCRLRWVSLLPWLAAVPAILIAGCSSLFGAVPPAQYEQTNLEIAIDAGSGLNPDDKGRAAPVLLKVYELRSESAFQEADFFSLQNADKATLNTDLLVVDRFILRPGETRSIRRKSHPEAKAIGVFVAYRDLPNATWRAVHRVPQAPESKWYRAVIPNPRVRLMVSLQPNAVQVTDRLVGDYRPGVNEQPARQTQNPQDRPPQQSDGMARQIEAAKNKAGELAESASGALPDKAALESIGKDPLEAGRQVLFPK